jgi:uncharacterized protein YaaN involved in tellurite resistance
MSNVTINDETQNTEKEQPIVDEKTIAQAKTLTQEMINANDQYKDTYKMITSIGQDEVSELKNLSAVLDTPIKNMMDGDENTPSSQISKSLVEVKTKADELTPSSSDLNPGWFSRIIYSLTGSSAVAKYATRFQSTSEVIQSISHSLKENALKLEEDNVIFKEDQKNYRIAADQLQDKIEVLMQMDIHTEALIEKESDDARKRFLQEELLFNLRNHIQDLQQVYAASQQAIISIDVLVKNNRELIRNVRRTDQVALTVFAIGATLAIGLDQQAKTLKLTQDVNEMTANAMINNSKLLKEQGAEIQKQAAQGAIPVEAINEATQNLIAAVEDVENFKINALPQMKESIANLNKLNVVVDNRIKQIDERDKQREELASGKKEDIIDVETE